VASGSRARAGRAFWFVVGLLARAVGAGVLFWLVFPLWLGIFWSVQGYPPTLGDLARWYALGAFNAAPIVATVGVSILLTPLLTIRLSSILPPSLRFPPLREGNRTAPLRLESVGSPLQAGGTLRRGSRKTATPTRKRGEYQE
jgi:hypothetical protein